MVKDAVTAIWTTSGGYFVKQSVNGVMYAIRDTVIPQWGFLEFTDADDGDPIYVRKDSIIAVYRTEKKD